MMIRIKPLLKLYSVRGAQNPKSQIQNLHKIQAYSTVKPISETSGSLPLETDPNIVSPVQTIKSLENSTNPIEIKLKKQLRLLPPFPEQPTENMCCSSGCETCVWVIYEASLKDYSEKAEKLRTLLEKNSLPVPPTISKESIESHISKLELLKPIIEFQKFEKLLNSK
ncbi:hypothetical protein BB560_004131 [Smittium megazygosporum]|uniref:Oxidoreductase-like domain-containing protein n=1 Tax=Smittium megazygosporum TaxID=133381 RepID=A0A2T9ZA57_9FUNG|nr:hypothetical protein BB560_004665 [Smittium megazygosporum]PVV01452.1 hypothetical protein BB560_004131 [Smittium megazygosporum]